MGQFPVIPWHHFIDHVRCNVNPLAADDHMKEVIQQLQLMGEVLLLLTSLSGFEFYYPLNVGDIYYEFVQFKFRSST